jgi:hypothetical protein
MITDEAVVDRTSSGRCPVGPKLGRPSLDVHLDRVDDVDVAYRIRAVLAKSAVRRPVRREAPGSLRVLTASRHHRARITQVGRLNAGRSVIDILHASSSACRRYRRSKCRPLNLIHVSEESGKVPLGWQPR